MNNDLLDRLAQGKEVDLRAKQAQDNIDSAKKKYDEGLSNPKANFEVSVNNIERNVEHRRKLINIQEGYAKDKAANDYEEAKKKAKIEAKYNLINSLLKDENNHKWGQSNIDKSVGEITAENSSFDNSIFKSLLGYQKSVDLAKVNYESNLKNINLATQNSQTKLDLERSKLYDDLMIPYAIQLEASLSEQERQRQISTDIMEQNRDLRINSTMEMLGVATNNLLDAEKSYGNGYIFGDGGFIEAFGQSGGHLADTSWDSVTWLGKSLVTLFKEGKMAKYEGNHTFENFMRKLGFNSASIGEAGREYFSIYDRAGVSLLLNQLGYSGPEIISLGLMGLGITKGLSLLRTPNMDLVGNFNTRISRAITNARKAKNDDLVLVLENLQQSVNNQLTRRIPRNQLTSYINSISLKTAEAFLKKYPHLKDEIANIIANPSLARSLTGLFDDAGKQILSRGDLFSIGSLMRGAGRAVTTPMNARRGVMLLASGITGASLELARRVHMQMEQRGQGAEFTWMDLFSGLNHMAVDFAGAMSMIGGSSKLLNKPLFGEGSLGLGTPLSGWKGIVGGGLVEGVGETLQTYWELSSAKNYNLPSISTMMMDRAKYDKENMMFEESFVLGALMSGMISTPSLIVNKIYNKAASFQLQRQRERLEELLREQENQTESFKDEVFDAMTDYNSNQEDLKEAYSNMSDEAREKHQANTKSMYEEAAQAQGQAQAVIDKHINSQKNQANQSTTSQDTEGDTTTNVEVPDGDIVVSRSNSAAQYALQNKLVEKQEQLAKMRQQAKANNNTLTEEEAKQMNELEGDIAEIQEAITNLDIVDSMYHKQTLNNMVAEELKDTTEPGKEKHLLDLQDKITKAKSNEELQAVMEEIKESPYISFNKKDLEELQNLYKKDDRNKNKFSSGARMDEFDEAEGDTYQNLDGSTENIKDASDDSNTTTRQGNFQPNNTPPDASSVSPDTSTTPDTDGDLDGSADTTTDNDTTTDEDIDDDIDSELDAEEVDRSKSIEDAIKEVEENEKLGHNEAVRKTVKDIFNTLSFEEQMYLLAKKYNSKQAEKLAQDYVLVRVRDVTSLSNSPVSPTSDSPVNKKARTSIASDKFHYIWVRRYFKGIDLATQADSLTDMIEQTYRKVSQSVSIGLIDKFNAISSLIRDISVAKQNGKDTAELEQQLDTAIIELQDNVVNYTQDVKDLLELYHFLFKNTSDFDLKRIISNNIDVIKKNFLNSVQEFKAIKTEIDNIKNNQEPLTENFFHKLTAQIKSKVFGNLFKRARDLIDSPKSVDKKRALQQAFDEIDRFISKVENLFDDANGELYKLAQQFEGISKKMKDHIDNYFNTQYRYTHTIDIGIPVQETGNNMSIKLGQNGQNILENILSFVGLITDGLGFTRDYHKRVARKLIMAMKTTSTKYAPIPEVIYGFAQMFNTADDVIRYRITGDNNSYSITIKELILKDIPLEKLPPTIREHIKNLPTETERRKALEKFISEKLLNKNNPTISDILNRKIEAKLAKMEPLFQAGLIGYANAIVNNTQVSGLPHYDSFRLLTVESVRESMWNTAKGILGINKITDEEANMLKGIMWAYTSTYFGDMRMNQDLRKNRNGNKVVAQIGYDSKNKDHIERFNGINGFKKEADLAIDKLSAEFKEGQGVIAVSTTFTNYLKDNFEDSFDSLQFKSNLAKIGNNMSSDIRNILRLIKQIVKKRGMTARDEVALKANSLVKFSINSPLYTLENLAQSLGIPVTDLVEFEKDENGNDTRKIKRLKFDNTPISKRHYKLLQDKFKKDKVTARDIEERKDIINNPDRARENPLNYIPILVKNKETGKLEFQYFFFPALTLDNAQYRMHLGFDINEISIGESMTNYMDKIYTQLREVGSLMSALGNAIYNENSLAENEMFDYSTESNRVNFKEGVFFATAIQTSSGRIHFDHPLFSPTSNKWVQSAFTKSRVYSKSIHDKTDTTGLDINQKKRSRYYQDMLSTTNDVKVILAMEIAFSDIFNIDVDKWDKTKEWDKFNNAVLAIKHKMATGKLDIVAGNKAISKLEREYLKSLRNGTIYTRKNTEYNDILNNNFQIAQKFCEVKNGVITSLDTAKLFHAFKRRDKDAIAVYNLISSNYKVGSIPKDRVFQKLQNKRIFDYYAKGNDINVWWLSTYVDGSSTTLAESGLTIQYYDALKAILKIGNIFTDKNAHIRDVYQAYETMRDEGLIPPIAELEGRKVDGYTGILATIVAQLNKVKTYSKYAALLVGSGILTRDISKKVATPVSYQSKPINAFKARDSKIDAAMRQMVSRFTTHTLSNFIEDIKKKVLADTSLVSDRFKSQEFVKRLKAELEAKLANYQNNINNLTEAQLQEYALFEIVNDVFFAPPTQITNGANLGKIVDRGGLLARFDVNKLGNLDSIHRQVKGVFGSSISDEFDYSKINNHFLNYLEQDRQNLMSFNQVTSIETEEFQEAMNNKSTAIPLIRAILALADYILSPTNRVSNNRVTHTSKVKTEHRELIDVLRHHLEKKMFDNYTDYFEVDKKTGKFIKIKNATLRDIFDNLSKEFGIKNKEAAMQDFLTFLSGYYAVYKNTNQMVFNTKSALNKELSLHSPLVNQSANTSTSWNILVSNIYDYWMKVVNGAYVSFIRQYSVKHNVKGLLDKNGYPDEKAILEYRKKNADFNYQLTNVMRLTFKRLVDNLLQRVYFKEILAIVPSLSSLSQIEQKRIKYILTNTSINNEERLALLISFAQEHSIGFLTDSLTKAGEIYTNVKRSDYMDWKTTFANVMPLINHSLESVVTQRIVVENVLLKQVYDSLEQSAPLTIDSIERWGQLYPQLVNESKLSHSDVLLHLEDALIKQADEVLTYLGDTLKVIDKTEAKQVQKYNTRRIDNNEKRARFLKSLFPIAANAVKEFTTLFSNINFPHSFKEQFLSQTITDEHQSDITSGRLGNAQRIYENRIENLIRQTLLLLVDTPSIRDSFIFDENNKYIDINGNVYSNPMFFVKQLFNKYNFKTPQEVLDFISSNPQEMSDLARTIGDSLNFIEKNPLDIVGETRLTPKDTNNPTIPLDENPFGNIDTTNITTPSQASDAVIDVVVGQTSSGVNITVPEQDVDVDIVNTNESGSVLAILRDKNLSKLEKFDRIVKIYKKAIRNHIDSVIDITHHGRQLGNINPQNWKFSNDIDTDILINSLKIPDESVRSPEDWDLITNLDNKNINTIRKLQMENLKRRLLNHLKVMTEDELVPNSPHLTLEDKKRAAKEVKDKLKKIIRNIHKYPKLLNFSNGEVIIPIKAFYSEYEGKNSKGETTTEEIEVKAANISIKPDGLANDFYQDFLTLFEIIIEAEANSKNKDFATQLREAVKSISAINLSPSIAAQKDVSGNPNLVMTAPTNTEPNPLEAVALGSGSNTVYVSLSGRGLPYRMFQDILDIYNTQNSSDKIEFEDLTQMTIDEKESRLLRLNNATSPANKSTTAIKDRQDKKVVEAKRTQNSSTDEEFKAEKSYVKDDEVKKKSSEIDSSNTPKRQSISIARQFPNNNNPTGATTSAQSNLTNKKASMQRLRADLRQDRASLTAEEKEIEEVFDFAEDNLELIEDTTEYIVSNQSAQDSGYTEVYAYEMDDTGKVSNQTETTIYVFPNNRNFNKFTRLHETIHALTMIAMSHPATRTLVASLNSIFNQVRDYLLANPQEIERLFGGHPNFTAKERFDYVFNTNKDDARNPYRRQAEFIATFLSEPKLFKFLKDFKLSSNYSNLQSNTIVGKIGNIVRRILETISNAIFRIFTGSSLNVTNAGAELLHISKMLSNFSSYKTIESRKDSRMMGKVEKVEDILQDSLLRPLFHMATLGIFKSIGARIKEGTLTQDEVDLAKLDVKFSLRQKDINMGNVVGYLRNPDIPKVAKYAMVTTLIVSHTLQLGKNMLNKPAIRSAFIDLYVRNMQILTEGTIFDIQVFQDLGLYRGNSFMKRYNQLFEDVAGKNQYIVANSERFATQLRDYSKKLIRESKLVKSLNMTDKEIEELDTHLGNVIWKLGIGDSVREGVTYKDGRKETTQLILDKVTSHLLGYSNGSARYNEIVSYTASEMSDYFQQYLKDLIGEGYDTGIKLTKKDRDKIFNFIQRATNDLALQRVQGYSYSDMGLTNAEQVIDMALKAFMQDKAKSNKSKEIVQRIENHIKYGKTSIMSNKHIANSIRQVSVLKAIEVLKTHSIYDMSNSIRYFNNLKRKLESKNLDGNIVKDLLHTLSKERNSILDVSRTELQLDYKKALFYLQKGYKFTDKRIQDNIYQLKSRFGDSIRGYHHYDNYTPYTFNPDVSIVKIYRKNPEYKEQKARLEHLGYEKVYDFTLGEIYKYDGVINYNQTTNNYGFIHNNDAPLGNISGLIQNDFAEQALELDEIKAQTLGWGESIISDYYNNYEDINKYIAKAIDLRFGRTGESTITRVANSLVKYRAVLPREIYEDITEQKVSMSEFMFNATKEAFVKQKRQTINNLTYLNVLAQQDELRNREFNHHTVVLGEVKEVYNEYTGRDEKRLIFNQEVLDEYGIRLNNDDAKELHNLAEMYKKYNEVGDKILVDTRLITYYFGFKPLNLLELVSPNKPDSSPAHPNVIKAVGWFQTILKKWIKEVRKNTIILNPNLTTQNFISNFMGLIMYRIPFKKVMYDGFKYARELELFLELQKQEAEVVKNMHKQRKGSIAYYEARSKVNHIRKSIESNPIYPLYKEGLYTNLVEDMDERNQIDRGVVEYINKLVNKKDNPTISAWIEEGLLTNQSDTYNMLARWNRYGDFIPRVILYYYEREQGTSHREAIRLARETFVDYTLPLHSSVFRNLDAFGLINYAKYKFRVQRVILKNFTNSPLRAFGLIATNELTGINSMSAWLYENLLQDGISKGIIGNLSNMASNTIRYNTITNFPTL